MRQILILIAILLALCSGTIAALGVRSRGRCMSLVHTSAFAGLRGDVEANQSISVCDGVVFVSFSNWTAPTDPIERDADKSDYGWRVQNLQRSPDADPLFRNRSDTLPGGGYINDYTWARLGCGWDYCPNFHTQQSGNDNWQRSAYLGASWWYVAILLSA